MILTLDVPESLAHQLRAAAAADGQDMNQYAVATLQIGLASKSKSASESPDDEGDLLDCLRQGIADDDAGRVLTLEELDTHVYGRLNGIQTTKSKSA